MYNTKMQQPNTQTVSRLTAHEGTGLRSGPKNPHHKLYQQNSQLIYAALCDGLSKRDCHIKVTDLCREAGISSPTFYLHFRDSNDAMRSYEESLAQAFYQLVPVQARRDYVLTLLLDFIVINQQYFSAAQQGKSHYLLSRLIVHYRTVLVGERVSDRIFSNYAYALQIAIACWLRYDGVTPESTQACLKRMKAIQVIDWSDYNQPRMAGNL